MGRTLKEISADMSAITRLKLKMSLVDANFSEINILSKLIIGGELSNVNIAKYKKQNPESWINESCALSTLINAKGTLTRASRAITDEIKRLQDDESKHDIVVLLEETGRRAYVCLTTGKTVYRDANIKGRPFEGGPILDFSKNKMGWSLVADDSPVVEVLRHLLVETAQSIPDMTVPEFIRTLPDELYYSPDAVKERLSQKVKQQQ